MVNGQVLGIWKRTIKKDTLILEPQLFYPPDTEILALIGHAAENFTCFCGKQLDFRY